MNSWTGDNYYTGADTIMYRSTEVFDFLVGKFPELKLWIVVGELDSEEPIEQQYRAFERVSGKVWKDKKRFLGKK